RVRQNRLTQIVTGVRRNVRAAASKSRGFFPMHEVPPPLPAPAEDRLTSSLDEEGFRGDLADRRSERDARGGADRLRELSAGAVSRGVRAPAARTAPGVACAGPLLARARPARHQR